MSQSASVVSLTEFQTRRAVKDMRSRSGGSRQFLWSVPGMGVTVLGFRPTASAQLATARHAQPAR